MNHVIFFQQMTRSGISLGLGLILDGHDCFHDRFSDHRSINSRMLLCSHQNTILSNPMNHLDCINEGSHRGYTDFSKLGGAAKNVTAVHET